MVAYARTYAERGWPVLPLWWPAGDRCTCGAADCQSAGKHPIHHLVPHGLNDATIDAAAVDAWWRSFPEANIGIRTGAASGLVVLDVDGEAGRRSAMDLAREHGRLGAAWVRTGSGGWHAYLAHPGGHGPVLLGRVGEGLDVRGDGGYVVAPPSLHASGRRYRWAWPSNVAGPTELPPAPGWLIDRAMPAPGRPPEPRAVRLGPDASSAYAAAAIDQEAREVALTQPGQRNERLNRAAFKLGQLVGAGLVSEATVTEALVTAGLTAGPGERKIRSTVARAVRAGMSEPRRVELTAEPAGLEAEPC